MFRQYPNNVFRCVRSVQVFAASGAVLDHSLDQHKTGLADAVRDATDGLGADVIYDPVGGDMFDTATRCIASEGRLLAIGFASGAWRDALMPTVVANSAAPIRHPA